MAAPPLPDRAKKTRSFKTTIEPWMTPVVVKAIEAGMPLHLVGGLVGVTRRTLTSWRDLGSTEGCPEPLLVEFALAVEEARAKASMAGVQLMQQHAAVDWRAAKTLLEAQDPETWGTKTNMKIEATVAPGPARDLSKLTDSELQQLAMLETKLLPSG
jgi:hypothetical protein